MDALASQNRAALKWIGTMVLIAAAALFAWRTVIRNVSWEWDFAIYSAASRAWGAGQNPYDEQLLYQNWKSHGGAMVGDISWLQSIVPPTTLALIWPFAALPRRVSFWAWYGFNCAWIVAIVFMLIELAKLRDRAALGLILAAWVLLLGPIQLGVVAGQPAVPAVGLIVAAMLCAGRGRDVLAGVLLGISAGLKLQLAGPFIAYFVVMCGMGISSSRHGRDAHATKRWQLAISAGVTFLVIAAIGIGRLELAHIAWFDRWIANIHHAASGGGPNDYVTGNVNRDHLLNLQVLFYAIFRGRGVAEALTGIVVAAGAVAYALWLYRQRERNLLRDLAPLAVLTLLPVYHRYYDAALLVIPLAAALMCWRDRGARVVLAMMVLFWMPVGWAVNLVRYGHVSAHIASQRWWDVGVMSFWPWVLGAMLMVLLCVGWESHSKSFERRGEEAVGNAHPT
jgi:hypothetical protein